ncbi:MAG: GntR family transcriptional regulator [Pseudomonadota bacterium]
MTHLQGKKILDNLSRGLSPLYYQIANYIRNGILTGDWSAGSRLSTEEEMAKTYGVSRPTIRRAKEILVEEGFIRSIQGSGCYVNDRDTWNPEFPTVNNLNDVFHIGSKMVFKFHEFGMVPNSKAFQEKLKNPKDRFIFQIKGVRYYQGHPISYVVYHLPFQFGSRIHLESLDENPFIPQIESQAGIQVSEGIQTISLALASRKVAQHLGLKQGAPVLVVETVYFDIDQKPIEYVRTQYRDKLPYSIRVKRN